ncbi:MAG TPA: hypothetical protein VEI97_14705 [bacterium]|nr:hypothetical protein [bacterium]
MTYFLNYHQASKTLTLSKVNAGDGTLVRGDNIREAYSRMVEIAAMQDLAANVGDDVLEEAVAAGLIEPEAPHVAQR